MAEVVEDHVRTHLVDADQHPGALNADGAMIPILIGYESVARLFAPVPIHLVEAIPIAVLGLAVNVGSVWLRGTGPCRTSPSRCKRRHNRPAAAGL